jgi:hypothetical protein
MARAQVSKENWSQSSGDTCTGGHDDPGSNRTLWGHCGHRTGGHGFGLVLFAPVLLVMISILARDVCLLAEALMVRLIRAGPPARRSTTSPGAVNASQLVLGASRRGRLANIFTPGVGVDTPSHFYSFSFAQSPDWNQYHPRGADMKAYFLRVVDESGLINEWSRFWLRVFMACCLPWYAYHSIDWSQSLATSFLVLSVSLLVRALRTEPVAWRRLCLSAVCLGINLNFASDLYLLPLALAFAYWWCAGFSRSSAAHAVVWIAVVMATLVPWMVYCWRATGAPLVKSTNQGHVMLIGLGQDPQHRFPTTYSDGDPFMYQILRDKLGDDFARRFYASCSYEADLVLRPAFVGVIMKQPYDYLDLIRLKLGQILIGDTGTYAGEFDQAGNEGRFGIGDRVRNRIQRYSVQEGRGLQLGTTLFAAVAAWAALRTRKRAWILVLVTIAYQYLSCSVAALQPQYVSNLILFQLLVCAHGVGVLSSWLDSLIASAGKGFPVEAASSRADA